jgi:hypothetical protein
MDGHAGAKILPLGNYLKDNGAPVGTITTQVGSNSFGYSLIY